MSEFIVKLSAMVTSHTNFSFDKEKLKIFHNYTHNSSYNNIKDIVSIVDDLNTLGVSYQIYDGYIQTQARA